MMTSGSNKITALLFVREFRDRKRKAAIMAVVPVYGYFQRGVFQDDMMTTLKTKHGKGRQK
jgi:hypothetical protein